MFKDCKLNCYPVLDWQVIIITLLLKSISKGHSALRGLFAHLFCLVLSVGVYLLFHTINCSLLNRNCGCFLLNFDSCYLLRWKYKEFPIPPDGLLRTTLCHFVQSWLWSAVRAVIKKQTFQTQVLVQRSLNFFGYHWKVILMAKKKWTCFRHVRSINFQIIMLLSGRETRRLENEHCFET